MRAWRARLVATRGATALGNVLVASARRIDRAQLGPEPGTATRSLGKGAASITNGAACCDMQCATFDNHELRPQRVLQRNQQAHVRQTQVAIAAEVTEDDRAALT